VSAAPRVILFKAGAPFPASADADYEFHSILLLRAGDGGRIRPQEQRRIGASM